MEESNNFEEIYTFQSSHSLYYRVQWGWLNGFPQEVGYSAKSEELDRQGQFVEWRSEDLRNGVLLQPIANRMGKTLKT